MDECEANFRWLSGSGVWIDPARVVAVEAEPANEDEWNRDVEARRVRVFTDGGHVFESVPQGDGTRRPSWAIFQVLRDLSLQ